MVKTNPELIIYMQSVRINKLCMGSAMINALCKNTIS